jgi:hypothetical protein
MGYPFASGFAIVTTSGCASTGSSECAHSVPERYNPHCTVVSENYTKLTNLRTPT